VELLELSPHPTVIFTISNRLLMGTMGFLISVGWRSP